jgi:hypothetical protein
MKEVSTLFLRATIAVLGLAVLALCIAAVATWITQGIQNDDIGWYRPVLWGLFLPALPFYIALFQAWKLLNYIDKNKAFSKLSVEALNVIKYCAFAIGACYATGMPTVYREAQDEDAPGLMLVGLFFVFAPVVVGVFAIVFQKLLKSAMALKEENDLTV